MKAWAVLAILAANVIGGLTYLWQKLALEGLPPITIITLRNLVALACMVIWLAPGRGLYWRFDRRDWIRLFLAGNLGFAAPLVLGILGVHWSTAGNGSLLILLEPAAILIFSWLLLHEPIRRLQVLGCLAGLVGALAIVTESAPLEGLVQDQHLQGNVVLAVHGVLWGLYTVIMKPVVDRHGRPVALTFAAMLLAMVTLTPATLWEVSAWQVTDALGPALMWTLWLGLLGSFLGTVLWTYSLTQLRASMIAPFVFLQPLAGVLSGHLVLGEVITTEALVGGAFIALGVVLVVVRPRSRAAGA